MSADITADLLIVAAGRGIRAGGGVPKQYRTLCGEPLLRHTIRACLNCQELKSVRVVIHPDDSDLYANVIGPISDSRLRPPVTGGDTRSASVKNGLAACDGSHVLIHDGARPLVSCQDISQLIDAMTSVQAATLAIPVVDALWRAERDNAHSPEPRGSLWRAQTPQAFQLKDIREAHNMASLPMADDVETARAAGINVKLVLGSARNIKVTQPDDFDLAERLMDRNMDIRTGNGFDVHRFGPGDHVTLNGIDIPFDRGLVGHSDADVAMHTLTDAIFGALADGDIGQWFPPSDPQWKGAASCIFLERAVERAHERGYSITHLDCTIICEMPKIGPHTNAMRQRLSEITGVETDRISVKATSTEKLGFAGRGEGIAAQATATLVKQ